MNIEAARSQHQQPNLFCCHGGGGGNRSFSSPSPTTTMVNPWKRRADFPLPPPVSVPLREWEVRQRASVDLPPLPPSNLGLAAYRKGSRLQTPPSSRINGFRAGSVESSTGKNESVTRRQRGRYKQLNYKVNSSPSPSGSLNSLNLRSSSALVHVAAKEVGVV